MMSDCQLILALIYAAEGKETRNRGDIIFKFLGFFVCLLVFWLQSV